MAGCSRGTTLPPPLSDPDGAAATAALDDAVFFDDLPVLADLSIGAVILLIELGVGVVVHCHRPSALTQE